MMQKIKQMNFGQCDSQERMRSEFCAVTPAIAKMWLENLHPLQRKADKQTVDRYAEMMQMGQWELSPDGIIFDIKGRLIQGQHRLQAVIRANLPILLYVTWGAPEAAFKILDQGKMRTAANAIGVPRRDLDVSNTVWRIGFGGGAFSRNIPAIERIYQILEPDIVVLHSFAGTKNQKGFSSAFKAAAVISMRTGVSREDVQKVWDPLVSADFQKFTPIMGRFYERVRSSTGHGSGGQKRALLTFCAAMKVFDPKGQNRLKLVITNLDFNEAARKCRAVLEDEGFRA